METANRGMVHLPDELNRAFRDQIRATEGDVIADAPISVLVRYWIAKQMGVPEPMRYFHNLPRGHSIPNRPRNHTNGLR